jgi:hypothetical protein
LEIAISADQVDNVIEVISAAAKSDGEGTSSLKGLIIAVTIFI